MLFSTNFVENFFYNRLGDSMLHILNSILWSTAILFLIGGGLYFTFSLKGIQFHFTDMFRGFKHSKNSKISPFQSLTMALAARIGVGSLAGIALAIYVGGPGSIFWIWLSSIITSVNSFSESLLGVVFREKDGDVHKGGPSFYMDKGLNKKNLARVYALLVIIAYIFGFMTIQSNTISASIQDYLGISPIVTGVILALISGYSILGGVKGIVHLTSKLVPVMGIVYIFLSLFIVIGNIGSMPSVLYQIINGAFNIRAFGSGIISTFIIGIQRGVFSTEAGLGSGAIASSTTDEKSPVKIGLVQVLGIYFVSFIICTSTAFIILTSDYLMVPFENINGIELTQYALHYHLGNFGIVVLVFSIISFAFSTIIAGYYYGESNLKYLKKNPSNKQILVLKIVSLLLLIIGSVAKASIIWSIVDILVASMAILNMYAVISLRKVVLEEVKKWRLHKEDSP